MKSSRVDVADLVGAAEAANILGVEVPRITRYRKATPSKMPPPAASLAATTVWHRADIEAMRDDQEPPVGKPVDVIGTSEAAALLGVDKSQVGRWRRAGRFPEPFAVLRSGPLWVRATVEQFDPPRRSRRERA